MLVSENDNVKAHEKGLTASFSLGLQFAHKRKGILTGLERFLATKAYRLSNNRKEVR
jgi:hypothetical protein